MNKAMLILFSLMLISFASATNSQLDSESFGSYNLRRLAIEKLQGFDKITKAHISRRLQSHATGKWRRMKIFFDLTTLEKENPSKVDFYRKVFWITGKWWEQAVWINDSVEGKNNVFAQGLEQGIIKQFNYPEGKSYEDYDLVVDVHMSKDDGGTLAAAGPLYRHEDSQRPITGDCGITWFGDNNFVSGEDSINRAVGTIVHEFAHVMAFISMKDYHPHFTKYNKALKTWQWTGTIAREMAQKFYRCDAKDMTGINLQTMSVTEEGAHWSEAMFQDELLTPESGAEPEKVSPMTMGFLEDTKWYKANYNMIENYNHKIFEPQQCKMKKSCPAERSCKKGAKDFVTYDYKAVGYCEKDQDDGCYKQVKYNNRDVSKPAAWPEYIKKYGASWTESSIIAKGNFIRFTASGDDGFDGITSTPVVPVSVDCGPSNRHYTLTFKDYAVNPEASTYEGDRKVICDKQGEIKKFNCYSGYCSEVICYDPADMCAKRFSSIGAVGPKFKHCDKSCAKNGRCLPGMGYLHHGLKIDKAKLIKMQNKRILAHFPDTGKERKLAAADRTRDVLHAMDNTQLAKWIAARKLKCKGMSKDMTCGPKKGFCRRGYCHSKTRECGIWSPYYKHQDRPYNAKEICEDLWFAQELVQLRKKRETYLQGWNVDQSGNSVFKNMLNDSDGQIDNEAHEHSFPTTSGPKSLKQKLGKPSASNATPSAVSDTDAHKDDEKKLRKIPKLKTAKKTASKTGIDKKWLARSQTPIIRPSSKDVERFAKISHKGKWQCWCYSDAKAAHTCPDLPEDAK